MAAEGTGEFPCWNDLSSIAAKMLDPNLQPEYIKQFYDEWAKSGTYDTINGPNVYSSPFRMLAEMEHLFPTDRENVRVLDVGAGSGLPAKMLYDVGFTNMDALDASEEMLRLAKEKGIYKNYFNVMMTGNPLDIPENSYDAIILVGVLGYGCLPVAAFEEILRLTKPGGYILNCMRASYLQTIPEYAEKWEPLMNRLQSEKHWNIVKYEKYPNHYIGNEGLMQIFQKCDLTSAASSVQNAG